MNTVSLIGRTTADLELRYTPNGKAVAKVGLAVNDGFGENKRTSFFTVQLWGKTAENAEKYVKKGSQIGVSGSLRQERWKTKDDQNQSRVIVNASRIDFLDTKNNEQNQQSQQAEPASNYGNEEVAWDE